MEAKYNNLEELRRKKALLKKEVSDMEDLLTFDNTKQSLSAFTNGFTDKFLTEEPKPGGGTRLAFDSSGIVKEFANNFRESVLTRKNVHSITSSPEAVSIAENALKLGAVNLVGKYARENLNNTSWKKKAIGLALIYVAPVVLKMVRERLENYQRNKTTSSMQHLI
ncbi:phosphoribosyl-ATP pyrophosphatase [Chryseobacterium sp. 6424]|uniref:phosphoribosyl-ATP pyrophosphatase n=1 Tax=Chryseobacterium sp. 6424 TaxID=2039166 RepID=UPI000EFB5ED8|nr:phosphoribosyl-ATP pyrophosphatase [Chryseobacterium sp. 6424]AYO57704.1 phosphoribosyl-ATP pyrophosphatase [Chryseobacterium sp. 6424]